MIDPVLEVVYKSKVEDQHLGKIPQISWHPINSELQMAYALDNEISIIGFEKFDLDSSKLDCKIETKKTFKAENEIIFMRWVSETAIFYIDN